MYSKPYVLSVGVDRWSASVHRVQGLISNYECFSGIGVWGKARTSFCSTGIKDDGSCASPSSKPAAIHSRQMS